MRIKNQFRISLIVFFFVLILISISIVVTQQQISQLSNQVIIVGGIVTSASDLNYISNNYFLYQDNSSIALWQSQYAILTNDIAKIVTTDIYEQFLIDSIKDDLNNLQVVFSGVILFLQSAPRTLSVRALPEFQTQWSRMVVQIQAFSFDAGQLSTYLHNKSNQLALNSVLLIVALLGLFGAYFLTNYFLTSRKTLSSIAKLEDGIGVIGSGDLDYTIKAGKNDEIAEISKSVNQMASNLKTVMSSKTDLEKEVNERKKAEEALRENQELYRTVFDNSQDGFQLVKVIFDENGNPIDYLFLQVNQAYERQVGLKAEQVVGKTVREIVPNIEQEWIETHGRVAKTGTSLHREIYNGFSKRWYDLYYYKYREGQVGVLFRDITERKEAEKALKESENRFLSLFDQSPFIFGIYDKNGYLVQVNPAWDDFWQVPREYVIGIWNPLYSKQVMEIGWVPKIKRAYSGEAVIDEEALFDPSLEPEACGKGRKRWLRTTMFPIKDAQGSVANIVMVHSDITEKKELEKELKDKERLSAIGATAGMVGHDIRNPLQAVIGETYLLKEELASEPEGKEKEALTESVNSIEKNVVYINKIVQDLQDFARPIQPEYSIIDLSKVFKRIFETVTVPESIKFSIKVKNLEKLRTDPMLLQRALSNLVTNAIQAMPESGILEITGQPQENKAIITISDTGVGIPDEIKPKLFIPMMTTKAKGQGFGLAVSKRLVEALKGTIRFESEKGKGTKFIIELPITR